MATATAKLAPRERLLEAADQLFYAEGIQSVGIDRVIERAGVAKASLYSSFGSKEGLIEAYLKRRHSNKLRQFREAIDEFDEPLAKILAIYDQQAKIATAADYHGCPFIAASAEAPAGGLVDEETRAFRRDVHTLFHELAMGVGASDPHALATQLHIIYDGATTAAKFQQAASASGPAREMAIVVVEAARKQAVATPAT